MGEVDGTFDEEYLKEFKRVYSQSGPHHIEKQTPYLTALAKHYEKKGRENPRKNWTDILKAHALYNSCAVRESTTGTWRENAFQVQQLYWGDDVRITYQVQAEMTEHLLSELRLIRDCCRDEHLRHPNEEIEEWESDIWELNKMGDEGIYSETRKFVKLMEIVSKIPNNQMLKFAEHCVEKAVTLCEESPCKFAVVSLGSMARGEMTPYSDWEFLFLISEKTPETVSYFELLAMTCYLIIGNLGETKLKYMNITELKGWFEDHAKSGFKIDGLQNGAGNIPTGNGIKTQEKNKFILTPRELKQWYADESANPKREEALKGDLTAMLECTSLVYGCRDLLEKFESFKASHKPNKKRERVTKDMLEQDLNRYDNFMDDRRKMDIKNEIYRYTTLLILNLKILYQVRKPNSWDVIQDLRVREILHPRLESCLKFILAAAHFIRLSMYLHYDSQHNQLLLSEENLEPGKHNEWILPHSLLLHLAIHLGAVQEREFHIKHHPGQIVVNEPRNPLWKAVVLDPVRVGATLLITMRKTEECDKVINLLPKSSNEDVPIWLKCANISMLYSRCKYKEAIESAKHCLKTCIEVKVDQYIKMHIEELLCRIYLSSGKKEVCVFYARHYTYRKITRISMSQSEKIRFLRSWADIKAQIDRDVEAENMYKEALNLAKSANNYSEQLECGYSLMIYYYGKNILSKATQTAREVLTLVANADFYADPGMIKRAVSAHSVLLGVKDKGPEEGLIEALKNAYPSIICLLQSSNDLDMANKVLKQLALIHLQLREYDRALLLLKNLYKVIKAEARLGSENSDSAELEKACKAEITTCLQQSGEGEETAQTQIDERTEQCMSQIESIPDSELARSVILSLKFNDIDKDTSEVCAPSISEVKMKIMLFLNDEAHT